MQPKYHTGDLVIAHAQSSYHLGEIVVVSVDGGHVIHRLWAGSATSGWETKGINKTSADLWRIPNDHVLGAAWMMIPQGGRWLRWVGTMSGRASLAAILGFSVALIPGKRRRRHPNPEQASAPKGGASGRLDLLFTLSLFAFALGFTAAGLAWVDSRYVGLRGWAHLPFTDVAVHPLVYGIIAVALLSPSLPLLGLAGCRHLLGWSTGRRESSLEAPEATVS